MDDKDRIRATKLEMRKVLLEEWDPIGIRDEPGAQNEYDSYLGSLYSLLAEQASEREIAEHLRQIETERMNIRHVSEAQLLEVAKSLKKLTM